MSEEVRREQQLSTPLVPPLLRRARGDRANYLAITVSDTGIGIREDKLDRIFESFEQADGSTGREYGGTGLGLAVTKKLVELHGGTIQVESMVGVGSQFTFTLPLAFGQSSEFSAQSYSSCLSHFISPDNESEESITPFLATNDGNHKFKILIVDDEPVNLQVLVNHLSLENYAIAQASNGIEALTAIKQGFKPDLILLDVMMPKMTGYEVCKKLRETFPANELPVVMLTAKNQVNDLVEGLSVGANDYLTKPISKNELVSRLHNPIRYSLRFIDHVKVKGKSKAVAVFEVFDGDESEIKVVKLATKTRFEEGVFLYYRQAFGEAAKQFEAVLSLNPKDKVAQLYHDRCQSQATKFFENR